MDEVKLPETIELRDGEPRPVPDRTVFMTCDGRFFVRHCEEWVPLEKYLRLVNTDCDVQVCGRCGGATWHIEGQYCQCVDCKQWYQFYCPYAPTPIKGEPSDRGWEGDTTL